jgi:hypothetical protein
MTTSNWAHILERAEAETFVGREQESRTFEHFLDDDVLRLLHVHGSTGIGKTSLLSRFELLARAKGHETLRLDGAVLDEVTVSLEQAFAPALQAPEHTPLLVLVDYFGELRTLHRWMRQRLLTRLPATVRVVSAANEPLSDDWLTAPGWEQLLTCIKLEELSEAESLELLERRGLDRERRGEVAEFGQGHPLALTIAADIVHGHPEQQFSYEAAVDDLQLLLRRLLEDAPSDQHRQALKLAALVRRTTEPLLAAVLDGLEVDQAPELLRWLARRPFVSFDDGGFFPHGLVRRLLSEEMRRFEETLRTRLLRRSMTFYLDQEEDHGGEDNEEAVIDLTYLLRDDLMAEWAPAEAQHFHAAEPSDDDFEVCLEAVRQHEGQRSAEIAMYWQQQQPEGLVVFRDKQGTLRGFCHFLEIDHIDAEDAQRDPAIEILGDYLEKSPLRRGEATRLCRYWMAIDGYQEWSGVQTRMFAHIFHQVAAVSGIALGLTVHAHPEKWIHRPDNQLRSIGEFDLGQTPYVVLGRDWRTVSRIDWLRTMVEAMMGQPREESAQSPTLLLRDEFENSVKRGLKHFHRGDRLESNPLVNSPLVLARCDGSPRRSDRVQALRELLEEACQSLGEAGGDRLHTELLERAYFQSDRKKQQAIADDCDMAYSTFRLHLSTAVERIAQRLWASEKAIIDL